MLAANLSVAIGGLAGSDHEAPTSVGADFGDFYYWMGLFFPKGTPAPIVARFNGALRVVLDRPELQARLREAATTVVPPERRSPEYLRSFLDGETKTWAEAIKASGIEPN